MKKLGLFLSLTSFLLLMPGHARADYEDGARLSRDVVAPLMAWVENQTGVRVPALPVVTASKSKLTSIVERMGRIQGRARALYVSGEVVLDHRAFDEEDPRQVSLLVHELVHYAQSFRSSSALRCAQEKEVEAYTLQNRWLEEKGRSPFVTASWIGRMAACPASTTVASLAQTR